MRRWNALAQMKGGKAMRLSLLRSLALVLRSALLVPIAVYAFAADTAADQKVKVDDNSFRCITEMTKVRHFYVDNLLAACRTRVSGRQGA
jgi:hypothetical protein